MKKLSILYTYRLIKQAVFVSVVALVLTVGFVPPAPAHAARSVTVRNVGPVSIKIIDKDSTGRQYLQNTTLRSGQSATIKDLDRIEAVMYWKHSPYAYHMIVDGSGYCWRTRVGVFEDRDGRIKPGSTINVNAWLNR